MRLSNAKLKSLDEDLFSIKNIDIEIATRKLEIATQSNDDENIGGGKSSYISKVPEELVMKYLQDKRIINLSNTKSDFYEWYSELTSQGQKIVDLRWFSNESLTWEEIGELLKPIVSKSHMYNKREALLTSFYKKINGL